MHNVNVELVFLFGKLKRFVVFVLGWYCFCLLIVTFDGLFGILCLFGSLSFKK